MKVDGLMIVELFTVNGAEVVKCVGDSHGDVDVLLAFDSEGAHVIFVGG